MKDTEEKETLNEDSNIENKEDSKNEEKSKEEIKIVEEPKNSNEAKIKKEKAANNKNSKDYLTVRIIIAICAFVLGAFVMWGLTITSRGGLLKQKVVTENVKTTTLEEMSDLKEGINNVYESAVYIEVSNNRTSIASGSGFVYKKDDTNGYILTNYHVIDGGNRYVVTFIDGEEAEASLVSGDEYYDIAVLKVDASKVKKVAALGDSSSVELGDTVFTVGAPLGKEYIGTITKGIISGVNRKISVKLSSGSALMEVIQTDASINNGNSGGPICNIRGEVIGITSSKLVGSGVEGMGFAIPINLVSDLVGNIETGSKITRPYIGVQPVDLTNTFALQYYYGIRISDDVEFGAVLSEVEEGMPADKAGLKVGDVIVEIEGEKVDDVSHFKYILYKYKVGDKIKVKYYRENKLEETTVELTESVKSE